MKKKITKIEEEVVNLIEERNKIMNETNEAKNSFKVDNFSQDMKEVLSSSKSNYYYEFCNKLDAERENIYVPDKPQPEKQEEVVQDTQPEVIIKNKVVEKKKVSFLDRFLNSL